MSQYSAYYARVSSLEQARNSNALNQQIAQLNKFNCDRSYVDIQSGIEDARPQFQALLEAIESQQVHTLYIRDMSRLARNGLISIKFLETLKLTNTQLYIVYSDRLIDLNDPDDFYKVSNEGLLAARESAILSKRIKRGKEACRDRREANSKPPFGYIRNKSGLYDWDYSLIEKATLKATKIGVARDIVSCILELGSIRKANIAIATKYGKDAKIPTNFPRWIKNPVLRGFTGYGRKSDGYYKELHLTHPNKAILSECDYQLIIARNKTNEISGKKREQS